MSGNWRRWLWHFTSSLALAAAAWFTPRAPFLVSLGAITLAFISFEMVRLRVLPINQWFFSHFGSILRLEELSRPTSSGYVLVAAFVIYIAFGRDIAVLSTCFLAVGDVAAAVVGGHTGKYRLFGRAVDGDAACFVACLAAGFALNSLGLGIGWAIVFAGSAAATLGQAIQSPVNDNLTLPMLSGMAMAALPG